MEDCISCIELGEELDQIASELSSLNDRVAELEASHTDLKILAERFRRAATGGHSTWNHAEELENLLSVIEALN